MEDNRSVPRLLTRENREKEKERQRKAKQKNRHERLRHLISTPLKKKKQKKTLFPVAWSLDVPHLNASPLGSQLKKRKEVFQTVEGDREEGGGRRRCAETICLTPFTRLEEGCRQLDV